ncbi:MAG: CBS domain-containing protein [Kiloniellales bacterium]|nr:CBS domain-containing protein [Kiloniellales bacterium]
MNVDAILADKGTKVATTRPDATIATVVGLLKLEGIGALLVSEDGKSIDGIISERDIVRGLAEHGAALLELKVSSLMTANVKTCARDTKVTDAMAEMTRSRIRHLPVIEDSALVGVISIGDVVKNRLQELETETSVLRDFIVGRS